VVRARSAALLVRACHPGPTVAVTALAVLLAVAAGATLPWTLLVGLAVVSGQLTIGWSNDLLDVERDRRVHRYDKPLATGGLSTSTVRMATIIALVVCLGGSSGLGPAAGLVHLVCVVGGGWAYNLGLKRTVVSFVPYAVSFGALPGVIQLSQHPTRLPPLWMLATGAVIGVAAHLVNALPDLADDASTGVVGLPHRLGERRARWSAALLLVGGSLLALTGPPGAAPGWAWVVLIVVVAVSMIIFAGNAKLPFLAALAVAVIDVVVLVVRSF